MANMYTLRALLLSPNQFRNPVHQYGGVDTSQCRFVQRGNMRTDGCRSALDGSTKSYPKPDEYSKMKKVILDELNKRKYPEEKFVFTTLINRTEIQTLRRDVEQYVDAGMTHFTLGEKAENEKCLQEIGLRRERGRRIFLENWQEPQAGSYHSFPTI